MFKEYAEGQLTCRELGAKYGLTKGETRDIINRCRMKQKPSGITLITDETFSSNNTVDEATKKYIKKLKLLLLQELMKKAGK